MTSPPLYDQVCGILAQEEGRDPAPPPCVDVLLFYEVDSLAVVINCDFTHPLGHVLYINKL